MKKNRFTLVDFFKFEEEEPRASWSDSVRALQILDGPRKRQQFVIVEYHYSFMNAANFLCHFYTSEENMRNAFLVGLEKHLKSKKTKPTVKMSLVLRQTFPELMGEHQKPSPYEGHKGHLKTIKYEDFILPWFFAKKGQRIRGDRVLK